MVWRDYVGTIILTNTAFVHPEIFYKRSTDGGNTWTVSKRLTWSPEISGSPKIFCDLKGIIHLVWHDNTPGNFEIYYKQSQDGGNTWIGQKRLTWNSGWSEWPAIAVGPVGNVHVLWKDETPGEETIFYKSSTNYGSTWGATKRLTWVGQGYSRPTVVVDSSGIAHVVYESYNVPYNGNEELFYKRTSDNGATWSGYKRLTWNSGTSFHADIIADHNDVLYLVWADYSSGDTEIYYRNSTNGGGIWSSTERLTWEKNEPFVPRLSYDSNNNLHLVWYDFYHGNFEIYYRKGIQ